MTNIYACLIGNWVNLNDDPNCKMGTHHKSPSMWYEEDAIIYSPEKRNRYNSYYGLDSIHIIYKGKEYLINPIFIQIVTY